MTFDGYLVVAFDGARESNFLLNTMQYEQDFYDYLDRGGEKNVGT